MAMADAQSRSSLKGQPSPRVGPPLPVKGLVSEYADFARSAGIELMPWQTTAGRYFMATEAKRWSFREVAIVVARQNGKTELIVPRVLWGLSKGRRILHTAQNRTLPRHVFLRVAHALPDDDLISVRYANGQEEIKTKNGGSYTIIAPQRGARGYSADDLIVDEVREFEDFDFMAAAGPTLTASRDPQIIYLSNAGDRKSVMLNELRNRKDDPSLAYLEWSAGPDFEKDDPVGWAQANPALGFLPMMESNLQNAYKARPSAMFETEHLCRWVITMEPSLLTERAWQLCQGAVEKRLRPFLGISMDVSGLRASAVLAWPQSDGKIAVEVLAKAKGSDDGDPIDLPTLGLHLKREALRAGVSQVGFDPTTDQDLARYFDKAKPIIGRDYANASECFARTVISGDLRWQDADDISDDLIYAVRKQQDNGTWHVIGDGHPIPAVLAAIRAVWLASAPRLSAPQVF